MGEFTKFKKAVQVQFDRMKAYPLLRVEVDKDKLWDLYLASFPKGSNPIFRERTEHDCQCCKQFIRNAGNMVAIIDGELETIWDVEGLEGTIYEPVAAALNKYISKSAIENVFMHYERTVGTDFNHQQCDDGEILKWEHFYIVLPETVVVPEVQMGTRLGKTRSMRDVMFRGLSEITNDAVEIVLDLIAQNSLYRGEEHATAVTGFSKLKKKFDAIKSKSKRDLFVWSNLDKVHGAIRNTVIGTLLVDISEGVELEKAVKSFEAKVAPANYKRPTAVVTKAMLDKAKEKLESLGLTTALERRFATLEDININHILFANRSAKKRITGDVFADIAEETTVDKKKLDKVEEISIEDFLANIVPKASTIELLFENRLAANMVSLIAPVDPDSKTMFKWPNRFSWSYIGDLADAIKEKVKAAGGNVDGELCNRLAWYNADDLDFHMEEADGHTIMYMNRRKVSRCGGCLDVDANGADRMMDEPVENIYYTRIRDMKPGKYTLKVHQYAVRSTSNVGFEVEIDVLGTRYNFAYPKAVKQGEKVTIAELHVKNGEVTVVPKLDCAQTSKDVWGLKTQTFQKVNVVMLSPNHWDKAVGNKHYFFMLNACQNDGQARGFFNEFLTDALAEHRKVFEVVGSRMKTEESPNQLSGVGFSSTARNHAIVKVTGSFTRTLKVMF